MKLDKNLIKKHKIGFLILCFGICIGIGFMSRIFDITVETTEIEALVTNTFKSQGKYSDETPLMNIRWTDLNGEVQSDGSIVNDGHFKIGDYCTIFVDAETHSRRILTTAGSITMLIMGMVTVGVNVMMMKAFFERRD